MFIQCHWLKFTHFSGCFSFHRLCGSVQGSHNTFSLYSSLDSSRLWQSLLCLYFVTLTVSRRTDRVSCSISFHQGLCDVFLMLRLGLWICKGSPQRCTALLVTSHQRGILSSTRLIADGVTLITWLRSRSSGSLLRRDFSPFACCPLWKEGGSVRSTLQEWDLMLSLLEDRVSSHELNHLKFCCLRDVSVFPHLFIQSFTSAKVDSMDIYFILGL